MEGLVILLFIIGGVSLYLQFKPNCNIDFDEKQRQHFCNNKDNINLINKL